MSESIKCAFNLFKEGRTYTGHHRQYILENAKQVCYAPETREKIRLREALGYLGHGRRELAKKLTLSEVEAVKLPDGTSVITENIPSNVTTSFEVHKDGTVEHTQELLETPPGKVVAGLNASRIGGFSWACGGFDGGAGGKTKITDFHGFDYVMNPGFSANRGYLLESASCADKGLILESLVKTTGLPEKEADKWLRRWTASAIMENGELRSQIEEYAVYEDSLREDIEVKTGTIQNLLKRLTLAESNEEQRRKLITETAQKSIVAVPEKVLEAMLSLASEDDFYRIAAFFEAAGRVNLGSLPISERKEKEPLYAQPQSRRQAEYGTAMAAVKF